MTEATKLSPAPLDAYETAKSSEPIWTVQGGDPLGAPLLRIWAHFARIQAGVITSGTLDAWFEQILRAANTHPPKNDAERDEFLTRATATEEISWAMDAYLRGDKQEVKTEKRVTAMQRIDLFDARRRCVQRIHNAIAELEQFKGELETFGFMWEELGYAFFSVEEDMKGLARAVEVRRKK